MVVSVDFGKAQIDKQLLDALIEAKIAEADAKELARVDAFGGAPAAAFLAGLRAAATLFAGGGVTLDWGTLPQPWDLICPALAHSNGAGVDKALLNIVAAYPNDLQGALVNAIGMATMELGQMATQQRSTNLTGGMSPNQVAAVQLTATLLKPIDVNLVRTIRKVMATNEPMAQRRKRAGEQLIEWLNNNGTFIRTVYGQRYYLYNDTRRLYQLETSSWHAFLYLLTSVNPASTDFRYLLADCDCAAEYIGKELEVVRVAHWDGEQQILRVSRFDGRVYRLDGATIEDEANGDGPVLFDDAMYWIPYQPDFSAGGKVLEWSLGGVPHWEDHQDECSLIYRNWWLATFFTELCPTRPILVLKGEKGSGKTMALRIMLRMVFGPAVDVLGIPDRPDGFTALTSNAHIAALDNLDEMVKEIRDKIASLSTGKLDQLRKLFTTNEPYTIRYRCWLAVTSRTPDTLQRDDLVDRVLILPVRRIEDQERTRESNFLGAVVTKRNLWWGDCLSALNSVVAAIRRDGIPDRGGLRMEDWAALGTAMARANDQVDLWETGLMMVKTRQADFLLEDEVVVQGIEAWLSSQQYTSLPLPTRRLYEGCRSALFGMDRPDSNWPRSVRSFGRRLTGMRRELQEHLAKSGVQMHVRIIQGYDNYEFVKSP